MQMNNRSAYRISLKPFDVKLGPELSNESLTTLNPSFSAHSEMACLTGTDKNPSILFRSAAHSHPPATEAFESLSDKSFRIHPCYQAQS